MFILSLAIGSCNAQIFHKNASRKAEKDLFGKTLGKKKEVKVKESRSVVRAKKKQAKNKRKLDKEWERTVKKSQKRTIEIQSPEVQERMKQNNKDNANRDKAKKKKFRLGTKKAEKKYK